MGHEPTSTLSTHATFLASNARAALSASGVIFSPESLRAGSSSRALSPEGAAADRVDRGAARLVVDLVDRHARPVARAREAGLERERQAR